MTCSQLEIINYQSINLVDLCQNKTMKNLIGCWKQAVRVIEVTVDHVSSRSELLQVIPASPIPGEPLEILGINELELVNFLINLSLHYVSTLCICSLSILIFSSLDLVSNGITDL